MQVNNGSSITPPVFQKFNQEIKSPQKKTKNHFLRNTGIVLGSTLVGGVVTGGVSRIKDHDTFQTKRFEELAKTASPNDNLYKTIIIDKDPVKQYFHLIEYRKEQLADLVRRNAQTPCAQLLREDKKLEILQFKKHKLQVDTDFMRHVAKKGIGGAFVGMLVGVTLLGVVALVNKFRKKPD